MRVKFSQFTMPQWVLTNCSKNEGKNSGFSVLLYDILYTEGHMFLSKRQFGQLSLLPPPPPVLASLFKIHEKNQSANK